MEASDTPRPIQGVADIVVPDDLTIGRIEKRDTVATEVQRVFSRTLGVAFRLGQNVLWAKAEPFGFDNAEKLTADAEGIVCRAVVDRVFLNGATVEGAEWLARVERNDAPPSCLQLGVYPILASEPLRFFRRAASHCYYFG